MDFGKKDGDVSMENMQRIRLSGISRVISDDARALLVSPKLVFGTEEIELVVVSAKDLGFQWGESYGKIITRAKSLRSLRLCPGEVGPRLFFQQGELFPDSGDECVVIAMEPIDDTLNVFALDYHDGKWLLGVYNAHHERWCLGNTRFVFARNV